MFNVNYDNNLKKLVSSGIINPSIFYNNYEVMAFESFQSPNIHKFEKIKVIFKIHEDCYNIVIKSKITYVLFSWDYFICLMRAYWDYNIDYNIYFNNLLCIFNKNDFQEDPKCLWPFFFSCIENLIKKNDNVFVIKISFYKNDIGDEAFIYYKNLLIWSNHDMVLDDENFKKESDRWDRIFKGIENETDEEV